ncbi:unnamed protein product [Pleuronectes platessa]|uniref:Uncharacterized protein n=1 Tax=Pleuronectes platessa TaxID=8262 RepID=A0A9N7YSD9_PLEPL|nr:unnamed protein product [Pleuronectes platessa]
MASISDDKYPQLYSLKIINCNQSGPIAGYVAALCLKLNIPEGRQPDLKVFDQSDTEVDGEVFEEIVKESPGTFKVMLSKEELDASLSSTSSSCSAASDDTIILNFTMCDPPEEAAAVEGSQAKKPCHINFEAKAEHYYDPESGSGYLAWRLKTIQRKVQRKEVVSVSKSPKIMRFLSDNGNRFVEWEP